MLIKVNSIKIIKYLNYNQCCLTSFDIRFFYEVIHSLISALDSIKA